MTFIDAWVNLDSDYKLVKANWREHRSKTMFHRKNLFQS